MKQNPFSWRKVFRKHNKQGITNLYVPSYNQFNVGREVYIKLQGLYVGETNSRIMPMSIMIKELQDLTVQKQEKSQYEWLIFLDVDNLPYEDNFLKNYIDELNKGTLIIGGCIYKKPGKEFRYSSGDTQ